MAHSCSLRYVRSRFDLSLNPTQTKITDATRRWLQVLQALLRRQPRAAPAFVTGYSRHAIKGQVFPGTIPAAVSSQVEGFVLFGLSPEELTVFDAFEGDEYVRDVSPPAFVEWRTRSTAWCA